MRINGLRISILLVLLLLGVKTAEAQDQSTGTVRIYAAALDGADAPTIAKVQSLDDSRFPERLGSAGARVPVEIRALPPGRYRVTIGHDVYTPVTTEVAVGPGEIVWLRAMFRPDSGNAPSTVEILDRWHSGESVIIRNPQLGGLPASSQVWSLIDALVPWTLVDGIDAGGSETGRRGLFGVRDGSWTWNTFVLDGIDVSDPVASGGPLMFPEPKALQAVTVTSGLVPAGVLAPGGQVTLVPRRPAEKPQGEIAFSGTSQGMVSDRKNVIAPFITRMHSWNDFNAQFSSPIGARAGAFVSGRGTRASFFDRGAAQSRNASAGSLFAHAVARLTPSDEIRIVGTGARTIRPLEGGDFFLGRRVDERDMFGHGQMHWEHVTTAGMVGSVAAALSRGTFSPDLVDPVGGGVVDRVYDGPVPSPVSRRTSRRVDFSAGLGRPVISFAGSVHALRTDLVLSSAQSTQQILASPDVAELVGGTPARVWQFDAPSVNSTRRLTQIAWSTADDMRLGDQFAINAGFRVDRWSGRAVGAPSELSIVTVSPRLAVRSNFPSHHIAAYGAIGTYHPRVPLDWLAFGDPGQETARLYRWTDLNGNKRFESNERGQQVALAGFGAPLGSIDPKLKPPMTYEWVLGGEARLGTALVHATATIRHQTSLVRAVNVGIPISAYTKFLIPDQTDDKLLIPVYNRPPGNADADRYELTNPDEGGLIYHALEIVYEQPITPRFWLRASALEWWCRGPMAAPGFHVREDDQGLVGELFSDPNTRSNAYGANFYDRSYVAKVSGSYLAPKDVFLSFTANYRDGQAFAGFIVSPDLVQGPYPIQNYRRGRTRFTFTMLIDARVEKRFKVGKGEAALWLDIFNLPNLNEEVEEDPLVGPTARASTAMQPPRTLRAGFRIGF